MKHSFPDEARRHNQLQAVLRAIVNAKQEILAQPALVQDVFRQASSVERLTKPGATQLHRIWLLA